MRYDAGGRLLSEDYSPCEGHHADYSPEAEVAYRYDRADPQGMEAFPGEGQPLSLAWCR